MKSVLFAALFACCGTALGAPSILVFGDSLSAAYGIPRSAGWVALLGEQMKPDLTAIVRAARDQRVRVLLVGMRLPPNYGPMYTEAFSRTYREIAREQRVPLVPFLLEGIAEKPDMFQLDNLHPTAEAQPALLETVWRGLAPLLSTRR